MWHAPNQRIRAAANAKKRERERQRRPIHIRRISAHLENISPQSPNSPQANVRLLLNDLSSKGVGLYSSAPFVAGQEIILVITDPMSIKVRSRVAWCQEHSASSHILSSQPFGYRIGLEFILGPDQEQQLKKFCDEVFKGGLHPVR